MGLKIFQILIFLGTIIAWISLGLIIFYFDPGQISLLGLTIFYVNLFLVLSGTIFIISDFLKSKIFRRQLLVNRVRISVRHAGLFSILVIGWGILKTQGLLQWWNLALLIMILAVLEFFFISSQKQRIVNE